MKQQDREIRELKQDKQRQKETNAVLSKVITSQGAAQKRSEEAAVLYSYELTGLPRDGSPDSKREFVMWCAEQAGIPAHDVSAVEYIDMGRIYGVQTAIVKFGNKGHRTKMSKWVQMHKAWNPLKYYSAEQTWDQYKITGRYQETADQRERRDYLNVAWQILKELEGGERFKGEEGAYRDHAKASINDKAALPTDSVHLPGSYRRQAHRPSSQGLHRKRILGRRLRDSVQKALREGGRGTGEKGDREKDRKRGTRLQHRLHSAPQHDER